MFSHPENVTDVSNSLKLIIPVPPSWKDKPSNQEVTLGQRVEVPCGADGAPKPKIIWKKEIGMLAAFSKIIDLTTVWQDKFAPRKNSSLCQCVLILQPNRVLMGRMGCRKLLSSHA